MLSDADVENQRNSTVRLLKIARQETGSCGFHLTRNKWDPYPWISGVDPGSAADVAGLKTGDCVLEVNGEDIVGQRITEIAQLVKRFSRVTLLLWNVRTNHHCSPEAICCGPMPTNFQRLTTCMSSILTFLECPICLDTIAPPTYQCDNGHLICMRCRAKSERCPVCRTRFARGRSLLADQVFNVVTDTFDLKDSISSDVRTARIKEIFNLRKNIKTIPDIKVTLVQASKLLTKLSVKASSDNNLSSNKCEMTTTPSLGNEFNTSLKAKSLSSNAIFVSPPVSRAGSANRISRSRLGSEANYSEVKSSPASYHGSYECLTSNANNNNTFQTRFDSDLQFYCPFGSKCLTIIKGEELINHFQDAHDGPLVQYFKTPCILTLENILSQNETCYLINKESDLFFLAAATDTGEENSSNIPDIRLWIWYLGKKNKSINHHVSLKIFNEVKAKPTLSTECAVYSLCDISWRDVLNKKKGIYLSNETIAALHAVSKKITVLADIAELDRNN